MKAASLPKRVRWMGGLVKTSEGDRTVWHGILTNDPIDLRTEKRAFVGVACEHPEDVPGAISVAALNLEAEARRI